MKNKFKRLYLPFVGYGLLFLLVHNIFLKMELLSGSALNLRSLTIGILELMLRMNTSEPFMGAMWFCSSLLLVSLIFFAVRYFAMWVCEKFKLSRLEILTGGGITICYIVGYIFLHSAVPNVYCLFDSMMITVLFYFGHLLSRYKILEYINRRIAILCFVVFCTMCFLGATAKLQTASMKTNNPFILLILPTLAFIAFSFLSKIITPTIFGKVLSYCGEHSFSIMALHFISFKTVQFAHILCTGAEISHMSDFPVFDANLNFWTPPYLLFGVALPLVVSYLSDYAGNSYKRI